MALEHIFGGLAAVSFGILLWQHAAARRFPLRRRVPVPQALPALTLLKPMAGCDAHTRDCLRSWAAQDYPGAMTILCAVASADDPAVPVIESLRAEFPRAPLRCVAGADAAAANPKVAKLIHAGTALATPLVLVSDADVFIEPGFLAQLVAQFEASGAALLHCPYSMRAPEDAPATIEAIGVNADMWTQVLQSLDTRPAEFALGATLLLRRETLERIGGFRALGGWLADDNRLGALVAGQGGRILLATVPVECRAERQTWAAMWRHQLRWAATIRACAPLGHFFSILTHSLAWAAAWGIASGASRASCLGAAVVLAVRLATAADHWRRITGGGIGLRRLVWVPVRDALALALWVCALFTRTVEWRGRRHRLGPGGRLLAEGKPAR